MKTEVNLGSSKSDSKVLFIHGRPGPHPIHTKIALSVNSKLRYVDHLLRWHDLTKPALYRYISWFVNALFLPSKSKYNIIFSEGLHVMPIILKKLFLISSKQKTAALLANEVLYFTTTNKYSPLTVRINKYLLKQYDALFCIGEFQYKLACQLVPGHKNIYQLYNGIPSEKAIRLQKTNPDLSSTNILFIANGPSGWRTYYKGLDLMLDAFNIVASDHPALTFTIVGQWSAEEIDRLLLTCPDSRKSQIRFISYTEDIYKFFSESSLYLHCARGDAFPTTVLESLAAGLPVIISDLTGTQEIVSRIDPLQIVRPDASSIALAIRKYYQLTIAERKQISEAGRVIMRDYTEEAALENFQKMFYNFSKTSIA